MVRRFVVIAAFLAVGALNREMSGVLIWLALFAAYPRVWQLWLPCGVLLASIFVVLQLMIHAAPSPYTISYVWGLNMEAWRWQGAIQFQGLLIPLWILLYHKAQGTLRYRVAGIIIPYLILFALLGVWQEVRLLMPLFILGIPFLREDKHMP